MKKFVWKNKFLVSIMVLVLIGAFLIPAVSGTGAEQGTRASPSIAVTAEVDETADFQNWYANDAHNISVTVTNDGAEELSNVTLGVVIYAAGGAMEADLGNNTTPIDMLKLGESVDAMFGLWTPSANGTYYAIVNAMGIAYPSGGNFKNVYTTFNLTPIIIKNSVNVTAVSVGFENAVAYMEGSMPVYKNGVYMTVVTVKNNGNVPVTGTIPIMVNVTVADNTGEVNLTGSIN